MTCKEIESYLAAYLLNEGTANLRNEIETHLQGCEACNRQTVAFKSLPVISSDLQRIYQAKKIVNAINKKHIPRILFRKMIPIAAVAIVIMTIALLFLIPFIPSSESAHSIDIVSGNPILSDSKVITGDSQGSIRVFKRAEIDLVPHSELIVKSQDVVYLSKGSATLEVSKKDRPFHVKTSVADIKVIGTKFSVTIETLKGGNDMKYITVVVLVGLVQVSNSFDQVTASQGDVVKVTQDSKPEIVAKQDEKLTVCDSCKNLQLHACKCESCGFVKHCLASHGPKPCDVAKYCDDCAKKKGVCKGCGAKFDDKPISCKFCTWACGFNCKVCKNSSPCPGDHGKGKCITAKYCKDCAKKESACWICGKKLDSEQKQFVLTEEQKGELAKLLGNDADSRVKKDKDFWKKESKDKERPVKEKGVLKCPNKDGSEIVVVERFSRSPQDFLICSSENLYWYRVYDVNPDDSIRGEGRVYGPFSLPRKAEEIVHGGNEKCDCASKKFCGYSCKMCKIVVKCGKLNCTLPVAQYCGDCAKKENLCHGCGRKLAKDNKWIKEGKCNCPDRPRDWSGKMRPCIRCKKNTRLMLCDKCAKDLEICPSCQRKTR